MNKKSKLRTIFALILLTIAASMGTITNVQGSVILQDGFETSLINWTMYGSPVISSTPTGVNGSSVAQLPIADSSHIQYDYTATNTVTLDFFFILNPILWNTPNTSVEFVEIFDNGGAPICKLYVECNGTGDLGWKISYLDGTTKSVFIQDGIASGIWYRITETVKTGAGSGAYQLWIDSELLFSASNANIPNPASGLSLGCILANGYTSGNVYLDTVTLSNTLEPLPTPVPTATVAPSITPTATPTANETTTPAPTNAPTTAPTIPPTTIPTATPTAAPTTETGLGLTTILAIVIVIVVIVAVVVVVMMRKHKSGSGLPPPPPPPPPT